MSQDLKKIIEAELHSMMLPEEEEQLSGVRKPKVLHIEREVMSSSGAGYNGSLEAMQNADLSEMFPEEMSPQGLIAYIEQNYDVDLFDPGDELTIDSVESAVQEAGIGERDNTYNWGWWGPTMVLHVLGPANDEPYSEGAIIVSPHGGGDPRGNYGSARAFKLESYAEEAPWYDAHLVFLIQTDKGNIVLDAEDAEGYSLMVGEDETGIFSPDETVNATDVESELDFEDSEHYDLWS